MSEVMTAATFDILADAKYVLVTTFRRDGTPVPTPMGHAVADGIVYTTTLEDSGKVKRLRNNRRVTISACDMRGRPAGPTYAATARILTAEEGRHATRLKESRHRFAKPHRIVVTKVRRRRFVALAVEPAPTVGGTPDAP
jgi:hypothetical protein